ncbi:hypothetical protein C8Q70DRAFT_521566 [Cubamyces menziesii]|nr:hypothetical protein C8Q70DRAFT_521566 [Cubamyces menziesii]
MLNGHTHPLASFLPLLPLTSPHWHGMALTLALALALWPRWHDALTHSSSLDLSHRTRIHNPQSRRIPSPLLAAVLPHSLTRSLTIAMGPLAVSHPWSRNPTCPMLIPRDTNPVAAAHPHPQPHPYDTHPRTPPCAVVPIALARALSAAVAPDANAVVDATTLTRRRRLRPDPYPLVPIVDN